MEIAQYSVKPSITSIILPQFFKLIALCAVFYGGVWINFFLLDKKIPSWANITVIFLLLALLGGQLFITKKRAGKYHYDFFTNRIEFYGKKLQSILYSDIQQIIVKRSIFDIITGTGSVVLSKDFKISNISNYEEVKNYVQKLVRNFKSYGVRQASAQYGVANG